MSWLMISPIERLSIYVLFRKIVTKVRLRICEDENL